MERLDAEQEEGHIRKRSLLKNKYFWIGTSFALWMIFFDTNSFMAHWKLEKDIHKMELERAYLKNEIATEKDQLEKMRTDPAYLEKLARERFYMKRDNEDLFIVSDEKRTKKHPNKD